MTRRVLWDLAAAVLVAAMLALGTWLVVNDGQHAPAAPPGVALAA